jgi:cytochrome c oxidase subunit I+III
MVRPVETDLSVFDPPDELGPMEQARFNTTWSAPRGFIGWFRTINNIPIAERFMATGFFFFLVGGVQALMLRWQLGTPENTFLDPETYNQIFTMHGTTMMFLFVIPFIEAVANYVLPMLLGTRDLPFPQLTALSFWTYFFGGIFLYASFAFGVAPNGGWFAYVPLTGPEYSPGINMDWWDIGLSVAEVAAMGMAAELIIAVLRMRAAGMTLSRLPIFAWSMLVAAFMIVFAFTPLIVGTIFLELDRMHFTTFFTTEAGGEPLLWQHIFWTFGHPDVYIMFIPAVGMVSQVIQTFSRRSLVGYPFVVLALIATGFLSFGLWVHHMFTTGISPTAYGFFSAASVLIAIPSGIQVFSWIATMWTGRPQWKTPMLFAVGFIVLFVIGGLTGVMVALVPFDMQVHDSYFVVAHFHYVMMGGAVFPLFAGLYYWIPKMKGKILNERLGRWNFWVMFVGFNLAFFPMHVLGLLGMPRRIYTYPGGMGWDVHNLISTVGAFVLAGGVLLFLVNFFWSLRHGEEAGRDPWGGDTLEWSQGSPPAQAQFQALVEVTSRHPMWEQKTLAPVTASIREKLKVLDWRPLDWRGALVCSMADARPLAMVHMPGPTLWPFVMSVAFVFVFAGALFHSLWSLGIGGFMVAVALYGWVRPPHTYDWALGMGDGRPAPGDRDDPDPYMASDPPGERLPLAIAGPLANGWWGTIVFITILVVALITTVVSYFYIGGGGDEAAWGAGGHWAVLALGAITAAAGLHGWILRRIDTSDGGMKVDDRELATRPAMVAALVLEVAFIWLTMRAWGALGLDPPTSAYASVVLATLGFAGIGALILVVMSATGAGWAARHPKDPRWQASVLNASLVSFFVAAAAWIAFAAVHFGPVLSTP